MTTTRSADGALRHAPGSPASTGGRYAPEAAPAATATLERSSARDGFAATMRRLRDDGHFETWPNLETFLDDPDNPHASRATALWLLKEKLHGGLDLDSGWNDARAFAAEAAPDVWKPLTDLADSVRRTDPAATRIEITPDSAHATVGFGYLGFPDGDDTELQLDEDGQAALGRLAGQLEELEHRGAAIRTESTLRGTTYLVPLPGYDIEGRQQVG